MNSRNDRVSGAILLAVGRFDPHTASVFHDKLVYWLVREDDPTLIGDDASQRHGQTPRSPLGDGPAIALSARNKGVGERSRPRSRGRLERSFGEPQHPRLHMPVFKGGVDDIPG